MAKRSAAKKRRSTGRTATKAASRTRKSTRAGAKTGRPGQAKGRPRPGVAARAKVAAQKADEQARLMQQLGCEPTPAKRVAAGRVAAGGAATVRASATAAAGPPAIDAEAVRELREKLLANPAAMMATAPAYLGAAPTVDEALRMLNAAESALENAAGTRVAAAANRSEMPFELPPEHRFPGYDHEAIPIFPHRTVFETAADGPAWAATAAAAWLFRAFTRKPKLPKPAENAVYPLVARDGQTTVALFSDWGTGYYHSRYIAAHIARMGVAQAIHLGDVYYIGSQSQFDDQVTPVLEPLLKQMPVYMLNANHEMDSEGIPYFKYLRHKQAQGRKRGFAKQPQETSYFCLRNDGYQVIGIDTAYHEAGRYEGKDGLKTWLGARLEEGRDAGLTTVLLSQNEPYARKKGSGGVAIHERRDLLEKDLRVFVDAGLIHAWFWGDEHYAALYEVNDVMPFVGSCVGHGGYPFGVKHDDAGPNDLVRKVWAETGSRFEGIAGLRQDRGNNGFCHMTLGADGIALRYIDWRFRTRKEAVLTRVGNRLRVEE
ncbi:MAG: hypothetical protein IT177_07595 [Acidobacteria bacterium]|nr:hypothetical protein [Acidobacteriota bacterium]